MDAKKNLPLIFGVSIPILMILFVALSIYVPQMFVRPQYDFLYLTGNNNCYIAPNSNIQVYSVQSGKLIRNILDQQLQACKVAQVPELKIYLYSVANNKSQEVSFEDVQNLNLSDSAQSPDGFEIVNGNSSGGGFFPFFWGGSSDYDSHYIQGHNVSKKLNVQYSNGYYNEFTFLGWVEK